MSEKTKPSRSCGSCTACCKALYVGSIHKPAGSWCRFCNLGQGCKLYPNHPWDCRGYACEWLTGVGTEDDRPDKMGVVVDTIKSPDGKEIVFRFSEVYQGWFNLPHIKAMIEEVFAAGKIIYYAPIGQDPTLWVPDSIKPGPFVQSLIIKDAMEEN